MKTTSARILEIRRLADSMQEPMATTIRLIADQLDYIEFGTFSLEVVDGGEMILPKPE